MLLVTWNINSVRARIDLLTAYLRERAPDVLCLQELKCTDGQFPTAAIASAGYRAVVHGQRTYNGVAILARSDLVEPRSGLGDRVADDHARIIGADVAGIRVFSLYAPNGQEVGSPAYEYKLRWFLRLRGLLDRRHEPSQPLALLGDWNVAPEPIDVHNPRRWEGKTLFSQPERAALAQVAAFGLDDVVRRLNPGRERMFSWWDYRLRAFDQDRGLRLDHALLSWPLAARCVAAGIDRAWRARDGASDHAPVWIELADQASRAPRRRPR